MLPLIIKIQQIIKLTKYFKKKNLTTTNLSILNPILLVHNGDGC